MGKRHLVSCCVALVALMGLSQASHAETITAELVTLNPFSGGDMYFDGSTLSGDGIAELINDGSGFGNPAPFNGVFKTFCIDLEEGIDYNTPYTYTLQPDISLAPKTLAGGMGVAKALEIEELFGQHYPFLSTTDDLQAFQLAIWNIIYDTDTSVSDGQGDFYLIGGSSNPGDNTNGVDANAIGLANEWLGEAADPSNQILDDTHLVALIAPDGVQDQITTLSVPTPSALIGGSVLMVGLGLVGWMRRPAFQRQSA